MYKKITNVPFISQEDVDEIEKFNPGLTSFVTIPTITTLEEATAAAKEKLNSELPRYEHVSHLESSAFTGRNWELVFVISGD